MPSKPRNRMPSCHHRWKSAPIDWLLPVEPRLQSIATAAAPACPSRSPSRGPPLRGNSSPSKRKLLGSGRVKNSQTSNSMPRNATTAAASPFAPATAIYVTTAAAALDAADLWIARSAPQGNHYEKISWKKFPNSSAPKNNTLCLPATSTNICALTKITIAFDQLRQTYL